MLYLNQEIKDEIDKIKGKKNGLIPALHVIQKHYGFIPIEFLDFLSETFNISKAELWGIITFYSDFRTERPGKHIIKVCRSEACLAAGGKQIQDYIKSKFGLDFGQTTADKNFTLESVFCFGNCACGPSVMVDGKLYGRVSVEKIEEILETFLRGKDGK